MKDLIAALTILAKYTNDDYPTHCEHDELFVNTVDASEVSEEDISKLSGLGFNVNKDVGGFSSFKYGSN